MEYALAVSLLALGAAGGLAWGFRSRYQRGRDAPPAAQPWRPGDPKPDWLKRGGV